MITDRGKRVLFSAAVPESSTLERNYGTRQETRPGRESCMMLRKRISTASGKAIGKAWEAGLGVADRDHNTERRGV
jgi:hypothetical protein